MATEAEQLEVAGRHIEISHPDKVLYPSDGYTKRDVVKYFHSVAEVMVPHMRGKPLTMRRFPNGVEESGFFQKHASEHFPEWIRVEKVPQRASDEPVHHVLCDDAATLVYLVNQGCLEFHIALSTAADLERPVWVVMDMDPPEDIALADLRSAVRSMCDHFREAGLEPHVQGTGGKGFHVVAPLTGKTSFDEVRAATREMAENAAREDPQWLTTEHRKGKRGDRIFLDTNRNAYGQTMIAPYSLRARAGAPAATPLELSELKRATPRGFGLSNMSRRLAQRSDPWSRINSHAADFGSPARAR